MPTKSNLHQTAEHIYNHIVRYWAALYQWLQEKPYRAFIAVGILAFCVNLISLQGTFLSDEYGSVYDAYHIHSLLDFLKLFSKQNGAIAFRPIPVVTILIDYWIYGFKSWGHHITAGVFYALTCGLISAIVWSMGKLYYPFTLRANNEILSTEPLQRRLLKVSILSGILFAIFPNHHEAVTWLAGRADLLATLFYGASIFFWIRFLQLTTPGPSSKNDIRLKVLWAALTGLSLLLSCFSKETGISLPVLISILSAFYLWQKRNERNTRDYIKKIVLGLLPLTFASGTYLAIRHFILGQWVGGYTNMGKSVYLTISLGTLKFWILSPIKTLVAIINYPYVFEHFIQPHFSISQAQFTATIHIGIYIAIATGFIALAISNIRRKNVLLAATVTLACAITYYIQSAVAMGILPTLGSDLQSTRFYYLSSIPLAIFLAYWLTQWKKTTQRILTTSVLFISLTLFILNYQPWHLASVAAKSIQQAVITNKEQIKQSRYVYLINAPDNIYGAFLMRYGFPHLLNMFTDDALAQDQAIITSRGVAGTRIPGCIQNQPDIYTRIDLSESDSTVSRTITEKQTSPSRKLATLNLNSYVSASELHNIEYRNNLYAVTGSNPYITFQGFTDSPQDIELLLLTITPKNQYHWNRWQTSWTTDESPEFHAYKRTFWDFYGNAPDQPILKIPVCRYPGFVFSPKIDRMRIQLPYQIGETFQMPTIPL